MSTDQLSIEDCIGWLQQHHNLSDASIGFLNDKGFGQDEYNALYGAMQLPDETFKEKRDSRTSLEKMIERGDASEITAGRYAREVDGFRDISSEQALVQGRMKFAIEYIIALADLLAGEQAVDGSFISRPFDDEEKEKLRSIYEGFMTKDYVAAKIIEGKTKHDIVAANTWVTIRAGQLGLDDDLMRTVTHFARTSADVNTNVIGELYMKAIGLYTRSLVKLLDVFEKKATEYRDITMVAQTHGQDAQLTTLGHCFANLAEQIRQHASPLIQTEMLKMDGKIAGATGTDIDFKAAYPDISPNRMYEKLVEDVFKLNFVRLGNDQDCTNASYCRLLDVMLNIDLVVQKTANDFWHYAQRGILAKQTKKGESGSSAMPQKANPWLAEGCEALMEYVAPTGDPLKRMLVTYRGQGDLRRSIIKREAFHPVMLAVIGIERLVSELNNYEPNVVVAEQEIYASGPKIASSALQTFLRSQGVPDAYDRIKTLTMKPDVRPDEVTHYIEQMVKSDSISTEAGSVVKGMLYSVMDVENNISALGNYLTAQEIFTRSDPDPNSVTACVGQLVDEGIISISQTEEIIKITLNEDGLPPDEYAARLAALPSQLGLDRPLTELIRINSDVKRRARLLGNTVQDTKSMVVRIKATTGSLDRYDGLYNH